VQASPHPIDEDWDRPDRRRLRRLGCLHEASIPHASIPHASIAHASIAHASIPHASIPQAASCKHPNLRKQLRASIAASDPSLRRYVCMLAPASSAAPVPEASQICLRVFMLREDRHALPGWHWHWASESWHWHASVDFLGLVSDSAGSQQKLASGRRDAPRQAEQGPGAASSESTWQY
jgi:hypothetical protein